MLWQKKDGFAPQPGLNLRPPEPPTCHLCGVEFEPMTPKMTSVAGEVHHGCYDKYYRVVSKCCTHATPAEDGSFFSFMHRKYGCPDEGAKWPRAAQELGFE